MTRINLVDPAQLTSKHLMAEYRELPRIFTAVLKLQDNFSRPKDVDIPSEYVLGIGHMKFFYDKISWLELRYRALYKELIERGFNLDINLYRQVLLSAIDIHPRWRGDYTPLPEEIYLNMIRICKRSNLDSVLKEMEA